MTSAIASVLIQWSLIAASIWAGHEPAQTQNAQNPQVRLFLNSEGGHTPYRRCSVHVNLIGALGVTELSCEFRTDGGQTPPPLTARLELAADEITRMRSLFFSAELYDGRHIGCVAKGEDIPWVTLLAMGPRGDVVLLPECNSSFQDDSARRELLEMMRNISGRLLKAAEEARRKK